MTETKEYMEALAIAYLTGQASDTEVVEYKTLFESSDVFRNLVSEIGLWLAPLNAEGEDVPVPEGLLTSIMAEIEDSESEETPETTDLPVPANDRSAKPWKLATLVASLVAVLAIGSHFTGPAPIGTDNNQQLIALLSDSTQPKLMAIVYEPDTGHVVARLSNITIPDDGDLQLWLIREGGDGPESLGVLDRAQGSNQIEFDIPKTLQSGTDTLAVSLESLGGSKAAGPEGPVLFTGSVSELRRTL